MTLHEEATDLTLILQTDGLPGILITNRPMRDIANDALYYLTQARSPLFVRHGQLVRIQRKEDGLPYIELLYDAALKGILAREMNFAKTANGRPQHIPPPDNVVKDIIALGVWPFPALDTIIEFPVLRSDGTIIDKPGYDALTHLVYVSTAHLNVPEIPLYPTTHELRNELIEELIPNLVGESRTELDAPLTRDGRNRGMEGEHKRKMREIEEEPGKEAMRLHSEKYACPRRRTPKAAETVLSRD